MSGAALYLLKFAAVLALAQSGLTYDQKKLRFTAILSEATLTHLPVYDQRNTRTCYAYSATNTLNSAFQTTKNNPAPFHPVWAAYLNWLHWKNDPKNFRPGFEGGDSTVIYAEAKKEGVCDRRYMEQRLAKFGYAQNTGITSFFEDTAAFFVRKNVSARYFKNFFQTAIQQPEFKAQFGRFGTSPEQAKLFPRDLHLMMTIFFPDCFLSSEKTQLVKFEAYVVSETAPVPTGAKKPAPDFAAVKRAIQKGTAATVGYCVGALNKGVKPTGYSDPNCGGGHEAIVIGYGDMYFDGKWHPGYLVQLSQGTKAWMRPEHCVYRSGKSQACMIPAWALELATLDTLSVSPGATCR